MRAKLLSLWKGKTKKGRFILDLLKDAAEIFMPNVGMIAAGINSTQSLGIHLPVGKLTPQARELLDADIVRDTGAKIVENVWPGPLAGITVPDSSAALGRTMAELLKKKAA